MEGLGFGSDETVEDGECPLLDEFGEFAARDAGTQFRRALAICVFVAVRVGLFGVAVFVGIFGVGMHLRGVELARVLVLLVRVDRPGVDAEMHSLRGVEGAAFEVEVKRAELHFGQFPLEGRGLDAEVAEEADEHVAAEIAGGFKKQNSHVTNR